jgi:hypothetical protein
MRTQFIIYALYILGSLCFLAGSIVSLVEAWRRTR